jgi:preprotein translocase SecE subunit
VQFAFFMAAAFGFWFLDNLAVAAWDTVASLMNVTTEPNRTIVTASAAVVAIVAAWLCYRTPKINGWAHEVAGELSKVTWPGRRETYAATGVVLIVSLIAASILGVFDAAWSAVTDLIYKV